MANLMKNIENLKTIESALEKCSSNIKPCTFCIENFYKSFGRGDVMCPDGSDQEKKQWINETLKYLLNENNSAATPLIAWILLLIES